MANLKIIGPNAASPDYELLLTTSMSRTTVKLHNRRILSGVENSNRPTTEVTEAVGAGFLEKVYERALVYELATRGCERQSSGFISILL
jgi:hypothetical protein